MVSIQVEGMSCGHCAATVKKAISGVDPSAQVEVDIPAGEVRVESTAKLQALHQALHEAGFPPRGSAS